MQTFLPYEDFAESAKVLDRQRLGKQRVENLQIFKALLLDGGWANHPATRMWSGYENWLWEYHAAICDEWTGRGYKDTCKEKVYQIWFDASEKCGAQPKPEWLGNEKFHASHRSNLLRKDPDWYSQFGWEESNDIPYWWPTKESDRLLKHGM